MARSINSPGVQITETDLSEYTSLVAGTTIFVAGFADQGPTDETLLVSSISEFETIYGSPRTTSEQYFYHSCKEILNSPATLLTTRLPYGSGAGTGFNTTGYSALLYPATSSASGFVLGTPKLQSLTQDEYSNILQNNITWAGYGATSTTTTTTTSVQTSSVTVAPEASAAFIQNLSSVDPTPLTYGLYFNPDNTVTITFEISSSTTVTTVSGNPIYSYSGGATTIGAGLVILNSSQTTINEQYEGYYLAVTDNRNIGPDTDFTSVSTFYSLTGSNNFVSLPTTRLGFTLSASKDAAGTSSVSEIIEGVPTFNFGDDFYRDSVILSLFKVRNSIYEPNILVASLVESHIGSFDSKRKTISNVGTLKSSGYLEDVVNNNSNNLQVVINPGISQLTNWSSSLSANPAKFIQTSDNGMYANGVFSPSYSVASTKQVGSVTQKVQRALTNIESNETINVDLIVDAGLTTIHANTENKQVYNDADYMDRTNLNNANSQEISRWKNLFNIFNNFAANTRKDCMFIADPLRQIFVNGIGTKTMSLKGSNFTSTIYEPLKNLLGGVNSNYSAIYGNWVKSFDTFADRAVWLPSSGYVAAIYARVDANAQPWIAPAGLNRGIINNITDVAFNPNQKQRDFLYTISINPIVFFQGDGFVVFGQKTLQAKPSAFDRVNVRRLFLTLEKAVQRSLKYYVFEPNTTFTRSRLVNSISPILENAKNTEGLYEYLVVCDERNNTPDVIDRNELKVDIYIKPVRAAEFILVNFIATRTGQAFEELL